MAVFNSNAPVCTWLLSRVILQKVVCDIKSRHKEAIGRKFFQVQGFASNLSEAYCLRKRVADINLKSQTKWQPSDKESMVISPGQ